MKQQVTLKKFANEIARQIVRKVKGDQDTLAYLVDASFILHGDTDEFWNDIWFYVREDMIRLTDKQERELRQRLKDKEMYETEREALADWIVDLVDEKLTVLCKKELEKMEAHA